MIFFSIDKVNQLTMNECVDKLKCSDPDGLLLFTEVTGSHMAATTAAWTTDPGEHRGRVLNGVSPVWSRAPFKLSKGHSKHTDHA